MTVLPVVFLYVTFLEFGHSHGTRTSETIIVTRIVVHASPAWLLWSLSFGSRHGVNRLWWSLRLSGAAVAKGAKLVCLLNYLIFLWFWWNSKYITTSGMVHAWKNIQRIRTSLHRCEWSGWISGSSHSFFRFFATATGRIFWRISHPKYVIHCTSFPRSILGATRKKFYPFNRKIV